MKNLMYGGTPILVTDDVADAVLHYAAILAQIKASDVIAVPTVDRTGYASETSVLLGAGIPLAAEAAPDDELEDNNPSFVEELTVRIREVQANVALS
ncbi:hypothetical protein [Curtobacterium sp. VKM Ac-1395]|uniref:hypothetical protein n=1 Tax=Curtobacterium sp. VKM Ac-1395 TaxID=2783815 RepID=UPI00188A5F6F|nr:hypothetical protein [Curtobacterium sp. VKM Ac-1395]MBF4591671.1 hypothetical protein [Curtobacterium sp. VKM Ac-1395]